MENNGAFGQAKELLNGLKKYLETRYNLGRLQVTEKIVLITSFFITFFVVMLIFLLFFMFISFSLAFHLGHVMNYLPYGFLTVSLVYLLGGIVVYVFRKQIVTNPVLKLMLKIMFRPNQES